MVQHHLRDPRPRRLPRPAGTKRPAGRVLPPNPAEATHPYVVEIAGRVQRVAQMARLSPYTVLHDWFGMLEAALRRYGLNVKSYAMTGQFTEDPPEVQAIFRRARDRYTEASKKYPAVYREMQEAFSTAFALLIASAEPGLPPYTQSDYSPDVIGQVFLTCVKPGPAWWPFFPPWRPALAVAQEAIPDGAALIYSRLAEADLRYRELTRNPLKPEPGERFEQWFEAVLPYFEPLLFGPAAIGSSVTMLAVAAQFPDWAVKRGMVQFFAPNVEPLLEWMVSINAILYGLNSYELDLIRTANEIVDFHNQQADSPTAPLRASQPQSGRGHRAAPIPPEPSLGPTFEELFKKKGSINA